MAADGRSRDGRPPFLEAKPESESELTEQLLRTRERDEQRVYFERSASPYARGESAGVDAGRAEILRARGVVSYMGKNGKKLSDREAEAIEKRREAKDKERPPVDKMERGSRGVRK